MMICKGKGAVVVFKCGELVGGEGCGGGGWWVVEWQLRLWLWL